ncbi:MAG: phosphatidylserine/phosphatidylglycerophosphate/cardiolipin synthase family protein [Gammaproteobacteria bacterium]|nr:phosphatidylserine/phosphatidylglycerophosphate/cardiolipin synthase family protein [Gammaproteobacteria bacterium]
MNSPGVLPNRNLYFDPETYFRDLISDIDSACHEVILETYIFTLDDTGVRVLTALSGAAARGVKLKILIDGVGSYRDSGLIAEQLKSPDCELRVFHPLPWDFSVYRRALKAGHWYSKVFFLLASINHRDHRKLCLIDNQIAWLGSYNITADHANHSSGAGDGHWHDTGLRVSGSVVARLADNFDQVWQRKSGGIAERSRHYLAREEITRRRQPELHLLNVLELAQQRIWITNAYFNPSNKVLRILKRKAKQGVSVQLIVPMRSDIIFFPLLSRSFYNDLLQAGIRVFEYADRVLHSKTMLIDQQLLVGSTNLNYRSLFHDLELDMLLADAATVEQMEERFCRDVSDSVEITPRHWEQHPWLFKLLGWLSRFLRYWL